MSLWIVVVIIGITDKTPTIQRDTNFKSIHQLEYEEHAKDMAIDTTLSKQKVLEEDKTVKTHVIFSPFLIITVIFTLTVAGYIYIRKKREGT